MAFPVSPLAKYTLPQRMVIDIQRAAPGFHLYYTGGFHADREIFELTLPGLMLKDCVLTVAFEYVGNGFKRAILNLAGVGLSLNSAKVDWTPGTQHETGVGQCRNKDEKLEVLWYVQTASVPLKYGGLLTSTPSIFINLFAGLDQDINGYSQKAKVPLVIHELHFTMDDPGAAVAAAKANPVTAAYALFNITHDVLLGIGGFVLFYGRWKPRTPIKLLYSGTTVAEFTAPDDGQEVVLVKMYQGSFAASAASDSKSPPIIVTQKETVLSKLVVTEYEKIFEYKAVTGQITYK